MTRGIAVGWSDPPAGGRRVSAWLLDEDSFSPADAALEASSLGTSSVGQDLCVSAGLVLVLDGCWCGPGVSAADVLAATTGVIGALELSRGDPDGPPARLVLGPTVADPVGLDLGLIGVLLEVGGVQVATAAGAAALGHPASAAAEGLTVACRERGEGLGIGAGIGSDPGSELVVYTGRLTPLFPLRAPGHARAAFGHLGSVGVRVT